jgi:hypothetical protein
MVRSYFKPAGKLSYDNYVAAIKNGRSYVSDGNAHIIGFKANRVEMGVEDSRLDVKGSQTINISARVAANLPAEQDEAGMKIAHSAFDQQPYWNIERARIGKTRKVPVELIVNGVPVDTVEITADGQWKNLTFNYRVNRSSWMALRIFPSVHTNPIFVIVNGKPVRELKSAEWCRKAVDQCWEMKKPRIREGERAAAEDVYNKARETYDKIILECKD